MAAGNTSMASVSQLMLASALETIGATAAAALAIERAGDLSITEEELTRAQHDIDQMDCVKVWKFSAW